MPTAITEALQQLDILAMMPASATSQAPKGTTIYEKPDRLYVVIDGLVKVSQTHETQKEVILLFCQPDAQDPIFGETCFLGAADGTATALTDVTLMSWLPEEIMTYMRRKPDFALAMMQFMGRRITSQDKRIISLNAEDIQQRVARTLLEFPTAQTDGSTFPVTHEELSKYVGTSREIVTQMLNRFRAGGMLRYSRKGLTVNRSAVQQWLVGK